MAGMGQRIVVDRSLCDTQALCVSIAPNIFEVGDDDEMHVLVESPTGDDLALAERAVRSCPKLALALVEAVAPPD